MYFTTKFPTSFYLSFFVLSVALIGCNDHRLVPNPLGQFRLKTITYNPRGSATGNTVPYSITLMYDSKNQLVSYIRRGSGGTYNQAFSKTINVYRDSLGYVSQTGEQKFTSASSAIGKQFSYYTYTNQKQLAAITRLYYVQTGGHINTSPLYTASVDQKVDFVYSNSSLLPASRKDVTYSYTVRSESFVFVDGNATQINGASYTYDNKPNPFYGLVGLDTDLLTPIDGKQGSFPYDNSILFGDGQVKLFNKNNIITNTKKVIYNSDGLVTRIEYNNGNIEEFTYETK